MPINIFFSLIQNFFEPINLEAQSAKCTKLFKEQCESVMNTEAPTQILPSVNAPINSTTNISIGPATPTGFDGSIFFVHFNYFLLAFTVFYSIILVINFVYWRLIAHRNRMHHEAKGVKSIQHAWKMWARYLATLGTLTLIYFGKGSIFLTIILGILYFILFVRAIIMNLSNIFYSTSQSFTVIGQKGFSKMTSNWSKSLKGIFSFGAKKE